MYVIERRVCASHTDAEGRLKLDSALDMMQDCTHLWLESEPVFSGYLQDNGLAMLAASRQLDIRRVPTHGERLSVRTSIYDCRKYLGYRNTVIYDEKGKPCMLSWCVGVFVSVGSGKIARMPEEVLASLAKDPPADMEYLGKKISVPEAGARALPSFPVRRADIDFNRHMNNARYVEASMELLPEGFRPERLRIEYKVAARPGDVLYPSVIRNEPGVCLVILADREGTPYTVSEFTRLC